MPLITLDQILSPLRLDPNDPLRLLMSGSLTITGSAIVRQANPSIPALTISGSIYDVDALNVASSSLNVTGGLDGGTF
jgi:hypothetical protein